MMEITEKGAQRPAHRLPSSRAPILGMALDVEDHVLLTDLAKVVVTGGAHLVQEPADDREMVPRRLSDIRRRRATGSRRLAFASSRLAAMTRVAVMPARSR